MGPMKQLWLEAENTGKQDLAKKKQTFKVRISNMPGQLESRPT